MIGAATSTGPTPDQIALISPEFTEQTRLADEAVNLFQVPRVCEVDSLSMQGAASDSTEDLLLGGVPDSDTRAP
eukprot:EC716700.1.p2 GENE.EC716700.1~~EC716700.1.p2  ORF type:complete len:74 (+),score=7.47 EC716700.1:423-644(+)